MNDEIEDLFANLADGDNSDDPFQLPVKGLTVRLDAETRAEIYALSSMTEMSRQQLLETLVKSGLKTAITAYLANSSDRASVHFADLVHEFLHAEGVHPDIVNQISGVQIDAFSSNQEGNNQ